MLPQFVADLEAQPGAAGALGPGGAARLALRDGERDRARRGGQLVARRAAPRQVTPKRGSRARRPRARGASAPPSRRRRARRRSRVSPAGTKTGSKPKPPVAAPVRPRSLPRARRCRGARRRRARGDELAHVPRPAVGRRLRARRARARRGARAAQRAVCTPGAPPSAANSMPESSPSIQRSRGPTARPKRALMRALST